MRMTAILMIVGVIAIFACTGCGSKPDRNLDGFNSSSITEPENASTAVQATSTAETSETATAQETSDEIPVTEIELDKTYHNERFNFDVSYPGIWSLVEEQSNSDFPDQGTIIFIGNSNITYADYQNIKDISKVDYIRIYGQVSSISVANNAFKEDDFITDDGVKGICYYLTIKGRFISYIDLGIHNVNFYGMSVNISEEVNVKYGNIITKILKSIKLP